jgi:rare lipoprotein A
LLLAVALALAMYGCATTGGPRHGPVPQDLGVGAEQKGTASYYARRFRGRRTANGERHDPQALTAAHRVLPFGTRVRVTNLANDRSVVVRINDRGPFVRGRILDLSRASARELGFLRSGTTEVLMEVVAAAD